MARKKVYINNTKEPLRTSKPGEIIPGIMGIKQRGFPAPFELSILNISLAQLPRHTSGHVCQILISSMQARLIPPFAHFD